MLAAAAAVAAATGDNIQFFITAGMPSVMP